MLPNIRAIQLLLILSACTFCQQDSFALKSVYLRLSSYLALSENSLGTSRGPQIISGGIRYKPFASRLSVSLELGIDPIASYFSSLNDTIRDSRLVMETDSTITNVNSTTIKTGTILHMYISTPLRIDFKKIYAFIEPGFKIVYDGRTLNQTNQYSYYDQFNRSFIEYAFSGSDQPKTL